MNFKKISTIILSLIISVTIIPCPAAFAESGAEAENLPPLEGYASPVTGINNIKTVGLPVLEAKAEASSPVLAQSGDITYGDETLLIMGYNLENCKIKIWSDGNFAEVNPIRSDNNKVQFVVPEQFGQSTMLVWAEREGKCGSPMRVNEPVVWWTDRDTVYAGEKSEVRISGQCFKMEGSEPSAYAVYDDGNIEKLTVNDCNPYHIRVMLPDNLPVGRICKIYIHNGTGGDFGWSNAAEVKVVKKTVLEESEMPVVKVKDYGAVADDIKDDAQHILRALEALKGMGGGVLEFEAGEYLLGSQIDINGPFANGLVIRGAGKGNYDMSKRLDCEDIDYRGLSGTYTELRFFDKEAPSKYMFNIWADNVCIKDLNIFQAENGEGSMSVYASGKNLSFDNIRIVQIDARDYNAKTYTSAGKNSFGGSNGMQFNIGSRYISVANSDFHVSSASIYLADPSRGIGDKYYYDDLSVANVTVSNCKMIGYGGGAVERAVKMQAPIATSNMWSEATSAVRGYNVRKLIFENCYVQGFDRENKKVMTRTLLMGGCARDFYCTGNYSKDVAMWPRTGMIGNVGEQYLFHGNGADTAAIFNCVSSSGSKTVLRTDNISLYDDAMTPITKGNTNDNSGSRLYESMNLGEYWMALIVKGKGAGQQRVIKGYSDNGDGTVNIELAEPWIVRPDETSIINTYHPFRHITVYNVEVDNKNAFSPEGEDPIKSGGVLFYFDSADCIVSNNKFKGLTFGVAINTGFKVPSAYMMIRENSISNIMEREKDAMQGGDTVYNATFFHIDQGGSMGEGRGFGGTYQLMSAVGVVFRNNQCENGDAAAELTPRRWHRVRGDEEEKAAAHAYDMGNVGCIVENNSWKDVAQGIEIGNPTSFPLLRNNTFSFKEKEKYEAVPTLFTYPEENHYLLQIDNDVVTRDSNYTVNDAFSDTGGTSIKVTVDGENVSFTGQKPIMENDRILIPVRGILEQLGLTVGWEDETQTVTASVEGLEITMAIDDTTAIVNGEQMILDVPAKLMNGRTFVPVRFIAESLNCSVSWNEKTQTVEIEF